MSMSVTDPRIDRLYQRLPAIHRMRDAAQGYPLQALLRVIAEQVNAVEDGISQQYANWFIETAADWAVPYIGDLVGYQPVAEAGSELDDPGNIALARALIPRRDVANTIDYRRRKGTLALLAQLARDVAGWPAHAVEFYRLLGWNQNINHLHQRRARSVDVREMAALDRLGGPFDRMAHSVDARRIISHRVVGRTNIPSVGVFVWRLLANTVTTTPAHCAEENGPHCFTFSVLGQDAPLFTVAITAAAVTGPAREIAGALAQPAPIGRRELERHKDLFYGAGKSFAIWADGWAGFDASQPLPASAIIPADLSHWYYEAPQGFVAVDPVLGRLVFPPSQLPRRGVRVSYAYGFSAYIGGGEYPRVLFDPQPRDIRVPDPAHAGQTLLEPATPAFYRVGRGQTYTRLGDAITAWKADKPWDAVIELTDSGVFIEPLVFDLAANTSLTLRAASGARPVIRLLDWQTDLPDSLQINLGLGSRMTLDGLMVTGRGIQVNGTEQTAPPAAGVPFCPARVRIRHCTLVPGWGIGPDCSPDRPAEPSLALTNVEGDVSIEHSILGAILVNANEVAANPVRICIIDSILDATSLSGSALGALDDRSAYAVITVLRSTVFGIIQTLAVELAENSIFNSCVHVVRRQIGCMRYCYVPAGCRTPRRSSCQPDLVVQAVQATTAHGHAHTAGHTSAAQAALIAAERIRVAPAFVATRYGMPGYAQLADDCAVEIVRGADDESEMGVFHDLYQPQREANLLARLAEYTPAGYETGILHAT